jgi:hypothetical protein
MRLARCVWWFLLVATFGTAVGAEPPLAADVRIEGAVAASSKASVSAGQRSVALTELGIWNLGGADDPEYWTSLTSFHPASRVLVLARPLQARRDKQRAAGSVQAAARAQGYWPFRNCYEALLLEQARTGQSRGVKRPTSATPVPGETRNEQAKREQRARKYLAFQGVSLFRLTADAHGRVKYVRSIKTELPPATSACLRAAVYGLRFPPVGRATDIELSVELSPGDVEFAPAREPEPLPAPVLEALAQLSPDLLACYADARTREPGVWGRLGLALVTNSAGVVTDVQQVATRLPEAALVACVRDLLTGAALPIPGTGEPKRPGSAPQAPLQFTLRFGAPSPAVLERGVR